MPCIHKPCGAGLLFSMCLAGTVCYAQDLAPRAYLITPVHSNAVTLTFSYFTGSILFNGAAPITGASGNPKLEILSVYHTFSFFGRSANFTAYLPYGFGHYQGDVNGTQGKIYRSGLLDSVFRFSVNLKGGPAMSPEEFRSWRQKTLLGTSLTVVAPTGQYDPTRLINQGSNRWAFKPELGFSQRHGHWILDAYGRRVVLHHEPGVLLAQPILPRHPNSVGSTGGRLRGAPELRHKEQPPVLGLS